jgi:hypothetical protein
MIAELDPGRWIPWHVHSYEESYYVATGTAVVDTAQGRPACGWVRRGTVGCRTDCATTVN